MKSRILVALLLGAAAPLLAATAVWGFLTGRSFIGLGTAPDFVPSIVSAVLLALATGGALSSAGHLLVASRLADGSTTSRAQAISVLLTSAGPILVTFVILAVAYSITPEMQQTRSGEPISVWGYLVISPLSWVVGRFVEVALASGASTSAPSEPRGDVVPVSSVPSRHSFTDAELQTLLQRTHEAWRSGQLDHFSDHPRSVAVGKTPKEFIKHFKPALNAIAYAFMHTPPESDEFLVSASDAQSRLSYVLTNKYFYFFGLDQGFLANKYENGKVALSNIHSCRLVAGRLFNKAQLELKSGKTIHLKDLMFAEPINYIVKRLEPGAGAS